MPIFVLTNLLTSVPACAILTVTQVTTLRGLEDALQNTPAPRAQVINSRVDRETYREFRVLALRQGLTVKELLTRAMAEYVERHGGQRA